MYRVGNDAHITKFTAEIAIRNVVMVIFSLAFCKSDEDISKLTLFLVESGFKLSRSHTLGGFYYAMLSYLACGGVSV